MAKVMLVSEPTCPNGIGQQTACNEWAFWQLKINITKKLSLTTTKPTTKTTKSLIKTSVIYTLTEMILNNQ